MTIGIDLSKLVSFDGGLSFSIANALSVVVTGDILNVNLFDVLTGGATFEVGHQTLSANIGGTPTDSTLTTFGLDLNGPTKFLTIGTADAHVTIQDGTLAVGLLSAGANSWTTVKAIGLSGDVNLGGVVTASATGVNISFNNASGPTATPLDWAAAFTPHVTVLGTALDLSGLLTSVSGSLTGVNVANVLTGSTDFAITKKAVTVNNATNASVPAISLAVQLTHPMLSVGTSDVYARFSGGTLNIFSVAPVTPNGTSWFAVDSSGLAGSIQLGSFASASITGGVVQLNRGTNSPELNWATDVTGATGLPSFSGPLTHIEGTLESINIGGFVSGTAHFEFSERDVGVQVSLTETLDNALLVTFGLSSLDLTVGDPSGVHFGLTGGSLAVAVLTAPAPSSGLATDTRSWFALQGSVDTITVPPLPAGLDLTISDLALSLNRASGTHNDGAGHTTDAEALNWATALDLNGNHVYGETGPGTDQLLVALLPVSLNGAFVQASGTASLRIFDFVEGTVSFVFRQQTVDVNADNDSVFDPSVLPTGLGARGPPDLHNATLTTLGFAVLHDATHSGLTIGVATGPHFTVTAGTLALAVVTPSAADQLLGDHRSWLALKTSIESASLEGFDGFVAYGSNITVEINRASGSYEPVANPLISSTAQELDWTNSLSTFGGALAFDFNGDSTPDITIDFTEYKFHASGTLGVDFGNGLVVAAGTFDLSKIDVSGGPFDQQSAIKLTVSDLSLFAGVGGALTGALHDGVNPGTVGVSIAHAGLTLAIVHSSAGTGYTGLEITGGTVTVLGITGLNVAISNLHLIVNVASDGSAGLNWGTAIPSLSFSLSTNTSLDVSADLTVNIDGFVVAAGSVHFSKQTLAIAGDLNNATALLLDLTDVSIFAGIGGSLDTAGHVVPGSIGVFGDHVSATFAIVTTTAGVKYTAAQISVGSASLVGIPGVTATVTAGKVNINRVTGSASKLDWSTADTGGAALFGININALTDVEVAGTLGLNIGPGFVLATGGFSLVEQTVSGGTAVDGATALVVTLTDTSVFAGLGGSLSATNVLTPGSVGVSVLHVGATLALVHTTAGVDYTGLTLTVGSVSLLGIPGVTATVTSGVVKVNTSSTGALLNWSTAGAGGSHLFGIDIADTTQIEVAGTLGLNIGGFVVAAGGFSFVKQTVSGGTVNGASALVFTLTDVSVFAGVGGTLDAANVVGQGSIGVFAQHIDATLGLVTVDATRYTGLQLTIGSASLVGIPGVTATVTSGKVNINKASAGANLDWAHAGAGSTALFGINIPGATNVEVAGTLGLNIGPGFVVAAGGFSLAQQTVVGGAVDGATALVVTLTDVSVFAGVGGTLSATNVVTPGTIGVAVLHVSATLALVHTTAGTDYTGLTLTVGTASLIGIPGVTATITSGKVNINKSSAGPNLDWAHAGAGSTALFGINIGASTDVEVAGTLGLSIGGFVVAAGGFSLVKQTVTGGTTVDGSTALVITLTDVSVFAGVGGTLSATNVLTPGTIGVSVLHVGATLALVHTTGGIDYTGLQLTVGSASLNGIPGVTATITSGIVNVNAASSGSNLDWAHAGAGSTALFGISIPGTVDVEVAGTLGLSIGGFVVAAGGFHLTKQTIAISGSPVDGASALVVNLTDVSVFAGIGGTLSATNTVNAGTVGVSALHLSATFALVRTATTSYTGIEITVGSAGIVGIDALGSVTITAGKVKINASSAGSKLDWSTAGASGGNLFGLDITGTTDVAVSGTIALTIGTFVTAGGNFAFTKESLLVTPIGSPSEVSVDAVEIGIDGGYLFAGVGYGTTSAMGVSFTGLSVGLVSATAAGGIKYFAVRARGAASLVGITGFDIGGTLEVQMNTASSGAPIDFTQLAATKLSVPTGGTPVDLNFNTAIGLRVTGTAHLTISSFVYISAGFAIQQGGAPQDVTLADGSTRNVNILTVGISNGYAFVGANGPYWVTNPDGSISAPASAGAALGVAVSNVNLGIALLKPTDTAHAAESYFALTGGGTVQLVGLDALTMTVQNLQIEVNSGPTGGSVVNFTDTHSFGPTGLDVPTGTASPDVFITSSHDVLGASGDVTLSISQFVYISGRFAFEKGDPLSVAVTGVASPVDMTTIKIGAEHVHAFVGLGGPYWVTDTDGTVHAPGAPGSAIGLAVDDATFGLVLMKPVTVGTPSPLSYYALSATIAGVSFINPWNITITGTNIVVEVNGSNDPGHFADLHLASSAISVPTGGAPVSVGGSAQWSNQLLHAEGDVTLSAFALTLHAHISFESTTRTDNSHVIKIAISNLSFTIGDPAIFNLSGGHGNIFVSDEGFAAELSIPIAFTVGDTTAGLSFSATVSVAISTITHPIDETFVVGAGTEHLVLDAGPYLRVLASGLDITIYALSKSANLHGDFQFEQITDPMGVKVIRIAAARVSFGPRSPGDPTALTQGSTAVTMNNGSGAMILYQDGVAAVFSGDFNVTIPGVTASSTVVLMVNTRGPPGGDVNQTVNVNGTSIVVNVPAGTFRLDLSNVSVDFDHILTLTGNFTVQSGTGALAGATIYAATDVELFLGDGPYRNADGTVNSNAIGVLVTGATVGVVDFGGGQFAINASGTASLVGLGSFITLTGLVTVKVNRTNRAINTGPIAITGTVGTTASVVFPTSALMTKFSVGTTDDQAVINLGNVVNLSGVIDFTLSPSGVVSVDIPTATVAISIPFNGHITQAFSVTGAARFSFGGGQDFKLEDIRVSGFSIFGVGATIAAPATSLRAPTADLSSPYAGAQVAALDFDTASSGHIDVIYNSLNTGATIDATSILDDASEFTLDGPAAGLTINGRPTQLNSNTFRYSFTGALDTAGGTTVSVHFLPGTFSDSLGAANADATQSFTVFFGAPGSTPPPTQVLLGPSSGAVVNATTLAAKGYLDVKFTVPTGATIDAASIDGNEIHLTAPAGSHALDHLFSTTQFDVTQLDANTWRYTLKPATGTPVTQMLGAGIVNVEFQANSWTANSGALHNAASKSSFTIATDTTGAGTASNDINLGPLKLSGPSLSIADMQLRGTTLALTIAIGVNSATLAFGSGGDSGGMSASLTGILGKFEIDANLLTAFTAFTAANPVSTLLSAFSVPGNFSVDVATVNVTVPGIVVVNGAGIHVNWDPNYDPAAHAGHAQTILTVDTASVNFPSFGLTASIGVHGTNPGLTVRTDGFKLGDASLTIRHADGSPIDFLGLLQFQDIRVGVTDFGVTFDSNGNASLDNNSSFYFASGGVTFLPGKPVSGTITDGSDADTEALRATVSFSNGHFDSLKFHVDTLSIQLGSFLTLGAQDFDLNTGAGPDQDLVRFTSVSASLNIGERSDHGRGAKLLVPRRRLVPHAARIRRLPQPRRRRRQRLQVAGLAPRADQLDRDHLARHQRRSHELHADPVRERDGHQGHRRPHVLRLDRGHPDRRRQAAEGRVPDRRHRRVRCPGLRRHVRRPDRRAARRRHPQARRGRPHHRSARHGHAGRAAHPLRRPRGRLLLQRHRRHHDPCRPVRARPALGRARGQPADSDRRLPAVRDRDQRLLRERRVLQDAALHRRPGAAARRRLPAAGSRVTGAVAHDPEGAGRTASAALEAEPGHERLGCCLQLADDDHRLRESLRHLHEPSAVQRPSGREVLDRRQVPDHRAAQLLRGSHLDQRQAVRRSVAHHVGRSDGAVPRGHSGPGPLPDDRGQAADGLPRRHGHTGRVQRSAGAGDEPDRRPRRSARRRQGFARRPERARLLRLHLRRQRRTDRRDVHQRRRVRDHLAEPRHRARSEPGSGPRRRHDDDLPLLHEGPACERRVTVAALLRQQVAVPRHERQRGGVDRFDHRLDGARDPRQPLDRRQPDAVGYGQHRRVRQRQRRRDRAQRSRRERAHNRRRGAAVAHQRDDLPLLPERQLPEYRRRDRHVRGGYMARLVRRAECRLLGDLHDRHPVDDRRRAVHERRLDRRQRRQRRA